MSAKRSFRRLLAATSLTTLIFGLAIISPWILSIFLTPNAEGIRNASLACLFLPTMADWPTHLVSYALAALLALGLLQGGCLFWDQWRGTRRLRLLLQSAHSVRDTDRVLIQDLVRSAELADRVDLMYSDRPVAFCYGWLKPRVCISTGIIARLERGELQAILLHESHHLWHRDPLKTSVSGILSRVFFFLPIMESLRQQYLLAQEIEADGHVLSIQGTNRPLLGVLYKLLVEQQQGAPRPVNSLPVTGAGDALNQRLDYLLNERIPAGPGTRTLLLSSALITGISTALVLATWASAASALWHQAHDSLGC